MEQGLSMTGMERMQRVEELFHRAMEEPAAERDARLAEWCGADEALRREVLELLQAEGAVQEAMAATPAGEGSEENWAGRLVGRYRLLRLLGRGGMGVVYLAERLGEGGETSGEQVASKFVRRSLQGSPALQHFLLERDALASLQHPNIARLLDAGVTSGIAAAGVTSGTSLEEGSDLGPGVPYVVMEFIEGQRLGQVCDAPETNAHEVVRLMLQLCEAVGFVHRNLVLHRDLKPGNVMVTGEGVVKLLDFGTLKMLGGAAEPSAMTQAGMRPVTLRYAAPEHLLRESGAAPVTTAVDVYSLGVVLYRLLAGRLPPELEGASLPEWFARLEAGRVPPPSSIAKRALPPDLADDLDAIALKAMRFEPEARYASAQAMAEDLRRALHGRPVLARGEGARYRLGKWYGRNRGVFWAGAAAAAVLLAGLLVMRHETGVALAQERAASAGVEQERLLAHTLLFDYFDQLRALPGSTDAQKRAVTEALAYLNGLSATQGRRGRTESTRELEMDQVQGYTSMGSVLGSPYEDNLGQPDAAVTVLKQGVELARELAARYPNDTDVLKAQASVSQALANVYVGQIRLKEAVAANDEATAASERLASQTTATVADLAVAASSHDAMGDLLSGRDGSDSFDPVKAEQYYQQALAFDRRELAMDPGFLRARRGVAVEYHKLGVLLEPSDPVASAAWQQKALDWLNQLSSADRAKPAISRLYYAIEQHMGFVEVGIGKAREGLPRIEDVLARYKAVSAADPINDQAIFDLVDVEANLGESYCTAGMKAKCVLHYRAAVDDVAVLLKHDPKSLNWGYRGAFLRYELAVAAAGPRTAEAREGVAQMLEFARKPSFNAPDLPEVLSAMHSTGTEPALALTFAHRLLAAAPGLDSYGLTLCAQAADAAGEHAEARQLASRGLEELSHEKVATARQRENLAIDTALARGLPAPR